MRIALAKLLLANPDLLMLDEPTNHLDLESVVWLEKFLKTYEGAVILISHDRDLINSFANKVVELRDLRLFSYTGDYERFVSQRELEMQQLEAAARNQARKIAQTQLFINRFRYKNTLASRVQSRVKMLEKMERIDAPTRSRKKMNLSFPEPPRSGRVVIELDDVEFGYGDVAVYNHLDIALERGQKTALVGPNGAGKSTLLKLFAGVLEPRSGTRKLGHKVELGYFAQHQIEALNLQNTVLRELRSAVPPGIDVDARKLLGRFLFSGDDVDKKVEVLSGGERTRLALAKLLVSPINFVCMDEPTNHLDMWSRDVLEDALQEYAGTLVLITHDRHLIRNVATRVLEVVDGRITSFEGNYDYYLDKREPRRDESRPTKESKKQTSPETAGPKTKETKRLEAEARAKTKSLRNRIARIETELEKLNSELKSMEDEFADPDFYSTREDIAQVTKRYESSKRRLVRLEEQWAESMQLLETESN
jgi:ATP-binding cassette, subfamily F, member 3